jgi:hypothetical protein
MMGSVNDNTLALLLDVTARLEQCIRERDCPAIAALDGDRKLTLTDYDYLRDPATAAAFERRAAAQAQRISVKRWVLAVPQVWLMTPGAVSARAVSNHPLRESEQEAITWMSFDRDDGVDYGRVPYARRPSGEPVFGEPEMLTANVIAEEGMPGFALLRAITGDSGEAPQQ